MRRKVDVTVGSDICPLCGRRALADYDDEGIVCGACDSAFSLDRATGRCRYTRVSAAYQPLESRLTRSWLSRAEVLELGRTLTLGRARSPVLLVANHTCWWDSLVFFDLLYRSLGADAYAMMDAGNLRRLRVLGWIGGIGVERGDK